MKNYFSILILLFSFHSKAQYFEAIGNGQGLTGGSSPAAYALSSDSANHLLYVLGTYKKADGTIFNGNCVWNGNNYDTLFNVLNIPSNEVHTAKWGDTTVITWDESIRLMNGTQLLQVLPSTSDIIDAVCICNNQLYIAGEFGTAGGVSVNGIAKWNGTNWEGVGGGLGGSMIGSYIQCLGSYNGDLIAAGHFDQMGGVQANHIAKWNGIQWSTMGNGISHTGGGEQIKAMKEYEGNFYVVGAFDTAGTNVCQGFAMFDGANWTIPLNYPSQLFGPNALEIYHNKLFVAGHFENVDHTHCGELISWNGNNFKYYLEDCQFSNAWIFCMKVFDDFLYLGGSIDSLDNIYCKNIGRFSDDSITGLHEVPIISRVFKVYPIINFGSFYLDVQIEKNQNEILMLTIYDVSGRKVWSEYEQLINGELNKKIELPKDINNGIYFLKINGGDINETRKMVVQKQ